MTAETTETIETVENTDEVYYTVEVDNSDVLSELETLSEIERAQLECQQLILAVILVYITFRCLLSFVGRAFGGN